MMTDCLSMHRAYMAHIGRECTLFRCRVMKGFSILITLWGVDALLVSQYLIVNDMRCDYSFRAMMLMSLLLLLVLLVLTG